MLLHVQNDVQVARRASKHTCLAEPGKTDACAVFYAGRDFRIHGALAQDSTLAFAFCAGVRNHTARSLAGGASSSHAEETLLIANLAASGAGAACDRSLSRGRARAVTFFTTF